MPEECPRCKTHFSVAEDEPVIGMVYSGGSEREVEVYAHVCPDCGQYIIYATVPKMLRVYPPSPRRIDFSGYVPSDLLRDFEEARKVIDVSPNASAMLSRRCLQRLLREQLGVVRKNLDREIEAVLETNRLPSDLADDLNAVRIVGNFAAHPTKSETTGEIVDVEPAEAVWTLDVLEALFDFCFVAPIKAQQRRENLNKKLQEAGRKPLNTASVIMFPQRAPRCDTPAGLSSDE